MVIKLHYMKTRNFILFAFTLVVGIYACEKEPNKQTASPYAGKVKTITDNLFGDDSVYLYYDSITGNLKDVIVHNLNMVMVGDSVQYRISIWHDNDIIYYTFYTNNDTVGITYKMTTIGKQITSLMQIDSVLHTETTERYIYINNGNVDSVYHSGTSSTILDDLHIKDFEYTNGNCTYTTANWQDIIFPDISIYTQVYDTINITYTNKPYTNMLFYQQPIELHRYLNHFMLLFELLQVDGYYIIPRNNNLIDSVVHIAIPKYSQKYLYEFDNKNRVSTTKIKHIDATGTTVFEQVQHMTYY